MPSHTAFHHQQGQSDYGNVGIDSARMSGLQIRFERTFYDYSV